MGAKRAVEELDREMSYQVVEAYKGYVGKKVRIWYKDEFGNEKFTSEGWLKEWRYISNYSGVESGLYPFLVKSKKDGSMSGMLFPFCDNTKAEVKRITKIEEV